MCMRAHLCVCASCGCITRVYVCEYLALPSQTFMCIFCVCVSQRRYREQEQWRELARQLELWSHQKRLHDGGSFYVPLCSSRGKQLKAERLRCGQESIHLGIRRPFKPMELRRFVISHGKQLLAFLPRVSHFFLGAGMYLGVW